jgi:hypothetical protein
MLPLTLKTKNQMKKKSLFAAGRFVRSLLATVALSLMAGVTANMAMAQTPSSSSAPQTTPTQAAPGTVAISKANAAALTVYTGPKYDNRWEVYGGLNLMNGQAGQNLQHRYNMGGVEVMGTYWLAPSMSSTWLTGVSGTEEPLCGAGPACVWRRIDGHLRLCGEPLPEEHAVSEWKPGFKLSGEYAAGTERQPGTVLQPHGSVGHGGGEHRLQREREAGDSSAAGHYV